MKRGRDSSEHYMISVLSLMRHQAGRPRTSVRNRLGGAPLAAAALPRTQRGCMHEYCHGKSIVLHLPNIQSQRLGSYTNAYMALLLIPAS